MKDISIIIRRLDGIPQLSVVKRTNSVAVHVHDNADEYFDSRGDVTLIADSIHHDRLERAVAAFNKAAMAEDEPDAAEEFSEAELPRW